MDRDPLSPPADSTPSTTGDAVADPAAPSWPSESTSNYSLVPIAQSAPASDGTGAAPDRPQQPGQPDPAADPAPPAPAPKRRRPRRPSTGDGARHPAVFVDSSAIVALVDRDDAALGAATAAYRDLVAAGYRLFTTNYVVAETFDLLSSGVGPAVARRWLRDSKLAVYHADQGDERKAWALVARSEGKRGPSLTDAISLVVMGRLEVADAFAVDPNFLAETS